MVPLRKSGGANGTTSTAIGANSVVANSYHHPATSNNGDKTAASNYQYNAKAATATTTGTGTHLVSADQSGNATHPAERRGFNLTNFCQQAPNEHRGPITTLKHQLHRFWHRR